MHLAVFIVKILDPFSFLAALRLTVWVVRRWWQCIFIGVAVGLLGELILYAAQETRVFGQAMVAGVIAAAAHSAIALAIAKCYRQRRWVMAGAFAGAFVLTIIPKAIDFVAATP